MSNQADHVIVRLRVPPDLRDKIAESAKEHKRSMNADMVARLEQSFKLETASLGDENIASNHSFSNFTDILEAVLNKATNRLVISLIEQGVGVDVISKAAQSLLPEQEKNDEPQTKPTDGNTW